MKTKLAIFLILILVFSQRMQAERYSFGDCFSIDVSDSLELRNDSDAYTKFQDSIGLHQAAPIVFQPKGLGQMDSVALNSFCRILISGTWGNQKLLCKSVCRTEHAQRPSVRTNDTLGHRYIA